MIPRMMISASPEPNPDYQDLRPPRDRRVLRALRQTRRVNRAWHTFAVVHVPIAVALIVTCVALVQALAAARADQPPAAATTVAAVNPPPRVRVVTEVRTEVVTAPASPAAPAEVRYRVRAGDTLGGIAAAVLGDPLRWPELAARNQLPEPDQLAIGTELVLPVPGEP